jgi:hypothetical protein
MRSRLFIISALLIGIYGIVEMHAANGASGCFSMVLSKDNSDRVSPPLVTFLDSSGKFEVNQENGHYCVPPQGRDRKLLDVSFVVGKDRLYLSRMPIGGLNGKLSISYGKKESARLGSASVGKNKSACTLVSSGGEPEVGVMINPCVAPARPLK